MTLAIVSSRGGIMEVGLKSEALRVLEALVWLERSLPYPPPPLPLQKIATGALRGDDLRAEEILKELDYAHCVRTNTLGRQSGSLTTEGRCVVAREAA